MIKAISTISFACILFTGNAQVKIGSGTPAVNPAAVLELSNDLLQPPANWKSFIPPTVDFSNQVFTGQDVWGIAGSPTPGAMVYNVGETYANGFSGPGLYCWQRNSWSPVTITVTDKIRMALSNSRASYDAAISNNWVNVTAGEYNNLLTVVNGAGKYATPEIYMNTPSGGGWSGNYTVGGSNNASKVPGSSFIIAWSVRTGTGASTSLNSKLKLSPDQTAGYFDYGSPLPSIGSIAANTRVYFVLKTPSALTPAAPAYTAVYNGATYFLGNNSNSGAGPEYFVFGDENNPAQIFSSDSYSQVISTATRQW